MNPQRLVSLHLPVSVVDALARAARAQGLSPADVVRALLEAALAGDGPAPARASGGFAQVQAALAAAHGWLDLQTRLRMAGFVLRLSDAGALTLNSWPADRQLIAIEALGASLPALSIRFRAPFPGAVPSRELTSPRAPAGRVA